MKECLSWNMEDATNKTKNNNNKHQNAPNSNKTWVAAGWTTKEVCLVLQAISKHATCTSKVEIKCGFVCTGQESLLDW